MSRLSELLRVASQLDPQLGKDLEKEIRPLQERLPFGLNFERHAPEAVELAGHTIRRTSKVRVLPPRGSTDRGDQRIWRVDTLKDGLAEISTPNGDEVERAAVPVEDLILVAEFRDYIYPGLRPDGTVERGGDKPFHTVINGENFHVLEQLTFTHEKSVDAIYIDPPYNTGSRDWKYNNDYVEGDDLYRHSKWLAFMERRLNIAKRLLKPEDSVLIVTIDEKEYLRLGLLLEQIFPEARIQMVSVFINPKGVARSGFARTDEYYFYVMLGEAQPLPNAVATAWKEGKRGKPLTHNPWASMLRRGTNSRRADRPNLFYPIFISEATGYIASIGDSVPLDVDRSSVVAPQGTLIIWPLRTNGDEGNWQMSPTGSRELQSLGMIRAGKFNGDRTAINYLFKAERRNVESGAYAVLGKSEDGSLQIDTSTHQRTSIAGTQWVVPAHDAGTNGSILIGNLLPSRRFPFPKSLYAVEDALRFFVSDKPNAVVLDFFSGSGTTAHAVMRLNKQDGGSRQCISVTNNEVSAEEQAKLRKQKLRPGDTEWEQWGICDYITKPRIRAAITGNTPDGDPIKGDYKFVDEFPMADGFEENAAFFTLTYESSWMVSSDRAFAAIAPMLWLRAGATGDRIDSIDGGWAVADSYGILKDLDLANEFIAALSTSPGIRIAYIVTDDEGRYQQVANELPGIETVRLYEDYLRNCESTGDF